jgi:hypothetical protein
MRNRERCYKAWLHLYPKSYRSVRGDEILGTLLDATGPQHSLAVGDVLYIMVHALRVRLRLMVGGTGKGRLPQPIRLVTWIFNVLAVFALIETILARHGPKNPGVNWSGIVAVFVFIGLSLMVLSRRRFLYLLVIAVLLTFVGSIVVLSGASVGAIVALPFAVLALLLGLGWHRYGAGFRVER